MNPATKVSDRPGAPPPYAELVSPSHTDFPGDAFFTFWTQTTHTFTLVTLVCVCFQTPTSGPYLKNLLGLHGQRVQNLRVYEVLQGRVSAVNVVTEEEPQKKRSGHSAISVWMTSLQLNSLVPGTGINGISSAPQEPAPGRGTQDTPLVDKNVLLFGDGGFPPEQSPKNKCRSL